jgi:hypothetical protein
MRALQQLKQSVMSVIFGGTVPGGISPHLAAGDKAWYETMMRDDVQVNATMCMKVHTIKGSCRRALLAVTERIAWYKPLESTVQ